MPRAARIDVPNILQHVIVRGIEKRDIFLDDSDRAAFVQRFSALLQETGTQCLAWALMSNHFHLLLRPTRDKLSSFMRRMLTGYAVTFNLRHRRSGHLFQNRYKSIVCEEDPYLLELVRYIHLNPLRAGLVSDLESLDRFRWSGHTVLMGGHTLPGQDVAEVLAFFGEQTEIAREAYRQFISDAAGQGKRQELAGGGLQRVRQSGVEESPIAFDDRILGSGEFVQNLLEVRKEGHLPRPVVPLTTLVRRIAEALGLTPEEIRAPGRSRQVADARSVISYLAFRKMGYGGEAVAKELGISRSGVCRRASFGERLVLNDKRFQTVGTD
jgi:REP element-mobilizing transposase RayT